MAIDYKNELNPEQYKAVTTTEGPLLIIAGAGSGKTRVITFRMAYMLDRGVPQYSILSLTFTNKAAREMQERVKALTARKLQNMTVCTFHAFGVRVLRREIAKLGWRENFSIYDETDRTQLIKESVREAGFAPENLDLYETGNLFSAVKAGVKSYSSLDDVYKKIYENYQSGLKLYNAVDFDDLIMLPIRLFREYPETLALYKNRYRYIMVDEFQDTSVQQYNLLRLLAEKNICAVGDDDQSIYSWRGANYENIKTFERDFPDVTEIKLEQNYRSTETILEAANGVIAHNTNRKEKALWSAGGGGKPIEVFQAEDEREEAEFVAETIGSLRLTEGRKYGDFGVLVRANTLSRSIEEAFLSKDLPYSVSGGASFFQRKEIKDVISYLRVIANPDDDVNLLRIINTPRRGVGRRAVEQISEFAGKRKCSLWSAINFALTAADVPLGERLKADLAEFAALIASYRGSLLSGRDLAKKIRRLVDEIDYWGYLLQEYQKNDKAARYKFLNIESFIQSIETWERNPDNPDVSLYAYLNRITLITRDDETDDADSGKIKLMTIHAAKGLEFPVVFIVGAEDGIMPHARSLEEGEANIEEERRLFYVAITRARDKLFISGCAKRKKKQTETECLPSPFLAEIPAHLIDYRDPASAQASAESHPDAFARIRAGFGL